MSTQRERVVMMVMEVVVMVCCCLLPLFISQVSASPVSKHDSSSSRSLRYRRASEDCMRCQPGHFAESPCFHETSTVCKACPPGTFTALPNLDPQCQPCSTCSLGLSQIQACTSKSDTVCGGEAKPTETADVMDMRWMMQADDHSTYTHDVSATAVAPEPTDPAKHPPHPEHSVEVTGKKDPTTPPGNKDGALLLDLVSDMSEGGGEGSGDGEENLVLVEGAATETPAEKSSQPSQPVWESMPPPIPQPPAESGVSASTTAPPPADVHSEAEKEESSIVKDAVLSPSHDGHTPLPTTTESAAPTQQPEAESPASSDDAVENGNVEDVVFPDIYPERGSEPKTTPPPGEVASSKDNIAEELKTTPSPLPTVPIVPVVEGGEHGEDNAAGADDGALAEVTPTPSEASSSSSTTPEQGLSEKEDEVEEVVEDNVDLSVLLPLSGSELKGGQNDTVPEPEAEVDDNVDDVDSDDDDDDDDDADEGKTSPTPEDGEVKEDDIITALEPSDDDDNDEDNNNDVIDTPSSTTAHPGGDSDYYDYEEDDDLNEDDVDPEAESVLIKQMDEEGDKNETTTLPTTEGSENEASDHEDDDHALLHISKVEDPAQKEEGEEEVAQGQPETTTPPSAEAEDAESSDTIPDKPGDEDGEEKEDDADDDEALSPTPTTQSSAHLQPQPEDEDGDDENDEALAPTPTTQSSAHLQPQPEDEDGGDENDEALAPTPTTQSSAHLQPQPEDVDGDDENDDDEDEDVDQTSTLTPTIDTQPQPAGNETQESEEVGALDLNVAGGPEQEGEKEEDDDHHHSHPHTPSTTSSPPLPTTSRIPTLEEVEEEDTDLGSGDVPGIVLVGGGGEKDDDDEGRNVTEVIKDGGVGGEGEGQEEKEDVNAGVVDEGGKEEEDTTVTITMEQQHHVEGHEDEEGPPQWTEGKSDIKKLFLLVNSNMELKCPAHGKPAPNITWLKDGHPLDLVKTERTLLDGFMLTLNALLTEDSGQYTCVVTNSHGSINWTYTVDVRERESDNQVDLEIPYDKGTKLSPSDIENDTDDEDNADGGDEGDEENMMDTEVDIAIDEDLEIQPSKQEGDTAEDAEGKKRTAIIVGVAVGGVALFALGFVLSRYCRKQRANFKIMKKVEHDNGAASNGHTESIEFRPVRSGSGIYEEVEEAGYPATQGRYKRVGDGGGRGGYTPVSSDPNPSSITPSTFPSTFTTAPNGDTYAVVQKRRSAADVDEPFINGIEKIRYIDETTDDEAGSEPQPHDRLLPQKQYHAALPEVREEEDANNASRYRPPEPETRPPASSFSGDEDLGVYIDVDSKEPFLTEDMLRNVEGQIINGVNGVGGGEEEGGEGDCAPEEDVEEEEVEIKEEKEEHEKEEKEEAKKEEEEKIEVPAMKKAMGNGFGKVEVAVTVENGHA